MVNESNQFSIPKEAILQSEIEKILDLEKMREIVTRNILFARQAANLIGKEGKENILSIPNFEKRFHYDGATSFKEEPQKGKYFCDFFGKEGRFERKDDTYYLRGSRYVVSLDPNLEVRQKLNILSQDFVDGLKSLTQETNGEIFSGDNFLKQCSINDYVKNSAITLMNALVYREKIGEFNLDDIDYQNTRSKAISLAELSTKLFYSHLIGKENDYKDSLQKLNDNQENLNAVASYLENQYLFRIFSSRSFVRPEASHPLVIASAVYNMAQKIPETETIVGMPAGGTELAFALRYAYQVINNRDVNVVLIPTSIHSIKSFRDPKNISLKEISVYLEKKADLFNSKNIIVADDNSSTGRTLAKISDLILSYFNPNKITGAVAEIDIIRTILDKKSPSRTHIVNPSIYEYATNILPVSKYIKPKYDLRELSEKYKLTKFYLEKLNATADVNEKIKYQLFIENIEQPTEEKLAELNEKNAIFSFRSTFLSNFYPYQVTYRGIKYPSVEHAFQAQKFNFNALSKIPKEQINEINSLLQEQENSKYIISDIKNAFDDHDISARDIKFISNLLRGWGYVRKDWDDDKVVIMINLMRQKFSDPVLKKQLKKTETKYLVEGNTWNDTFWGVCDGRGRNFLGRILMYLRENNQ